MRVLTGADVSAVALNLSNPHLHRLQDDMTAALRSFSAERRRREASQDSSAANIQQPPRTHFTTAQTISTLVMPVSDGTATAVKTVAVVPGRSPAGAVTVFSVRGELLGVLSAGELTAFRTALVSTTVLRRSPWATAQAQQGAAGQKGWVLVVFGGGKQAEWHVRLVLRTVAVGRVVVVNRSRARMQAIEDGWLRDVRAGFPDVAVEALAEEGNAKYQDELKEVLAASDIICGTTPSTAPLFPANYLGIGGGGEKKKSRFFSLIGSYKPSMVEIDTETLLSGVDGRVVVDSIEDCLIESGELIKAERKPENLVEAGDIFGESGGQEVIAPRGGENVVFKCVGFGLMDLTVSRGLLEISREMGKGQEVEGF